MIRLERALEDCLTRIQVGNESPETCLALYPELRNELEPMLRAALKLRTLSQLVPAEGFKSRTRSSLFLQMQANPRRQNRWRGSLTFRYTTSLAALLLFFVTAGTALAQRTLPGDALYGWKLASESVWRRFQSDAVSTDLALAQRRLEELRGVSGMPALERVAIDGYVQLISHLGVTLAANPEKSLDAASELLKQKEQLQEIFDSSEADNLPDLEELFNIIPVTGEQTPQDSGDEEPDSALDIPLLLTPVPLPKKEDESEGLSGAGPGTEGGNEGADEGWLDDLSNLLGLP